MVSFLNTLDLKRIIFLFISLRVCRANSVPAVSYLLVTRVGPCLHRKSTEVLHASEMTLHKENYDSSLSGVLYISKDIENGWYIKATMQKCHDIRNLDTCDFFRSVSVIKHGCLESKEADVYNMFFQYVTPTMECPIKAGNYTITDFPFFTEDSDLTAAESKISTSVFGYTYRVEGYSVDHERILCLDSQLRLNYVRKHDWAAGKKIGYNLTTTPDAISDEDDGDDDRNTKNDDPEPEDDDTNDENEHQNGDDDPNDD